jgi:hypothetical protein
MNPRPPLLHGAAGPAELPGPAVNSFMKMVADRSSVFADDGPDGWLGMAMSGLAGIAAALAVAIVLTVYLRSFHRSRRRRRRAGFPG